MKLTVCSSKQIAILGCALLGLSISCAQGQARLSRIVPTVYYGSPYAYGASSGIVPVSLYAPSYYGNLLTTGSAYSAPYPTSYVAGYSSYIPVQAAYQRAATQTQPSRQGTDAVTAQFFSASQLQVQWSGDVSVVQQVSLGIFDTDGRMLGMQVITQLPVQAVFTLPDAAAYYGAQVKYLNGTVQTIYTRIE
jgi:hypothetical protein